MPTPIYKGEFWKLFLRDIFRSRRDPYARAGVYKRAAALLYLVAVLSWYGFQLRELHDLFTYCFVFGGGGLIFGWIILSRWTVRREMAKTLKADIDSTPQSVTAGVTMRVRGMMAITGRAISERWLKQNTVPEGKEPVVRRTTIKDLRKQGLWDQLPTHVRSALMMPDGSWTVLLIGQTISRAEFLTTTLWAMALTPTLKPTENLLTPRNFDQYQKLLAKQARGLRPVWDLRAERNKAMNYLNRCQAEAFRRGHIQPDNEELRSWLEKLNSDVMSGGVPFVYQGNELLQELSDGALSQVLFSSALRKWTLHELMRLLDGQDRWDELDRIAYGETAQVLPDTVTAE